MGSKVENEKVENERVENEGFENEEAVIEEVDEYDDLYYIWFDFEFDV